MFIETIGLCIFASFRLINNQSTATLIIFNILFASLFFYLNGSLNLKLSLLAIGNFTGFCWNFIFNRLDLAGSIAYGDTFNRLCVVFFPFVASLWIVSFWSLSLTVVHYGNPATKRL